MRPRKLSLLLAGLAVALGLSGIAHAVNPNIRGRVSGQDKLLPDVYAEAAKPKANRWTWREPSPAVEAQFRTLSANLSRDVCIAATSASTAGPQEPVLMKITGGRIVPTTLAVSPKTKLVLKNLDPFPHKAYIVGNKGFSAEVIQPNGPKSVMGKFKFSFPNQHTVFMHDTLPRDKYMFNVAQRTYSHGCIRVRNPMELAEVILKADKGWDKAKTQEVYNSTPNNHTIEMEKRVMVHNTYFTAMVDEHGKLNTFRDVYGHEKRIASALDGKWNEIRKGRDHLAPVELDLSKADRIKGDDDRKKKNGEDNPLASIFGGMF